MENTDHLVLLFREEAGEKLAELEDALIELESSPDDAELVAKAFRSMHTLKGSAAMVGFTSVAALTHELESVFELIRAGRLAITPALVGRALEARDVLRALLAQDPGTVDEAAVRLAGELQSLAAHAGSPRPASTAPAQAPAPIASSATFRIRFKPSRDLLQNGTNPLGMLAELGALGTCDCVGHVDLVPPLEELDPESIYLSWDILLSTDRSEAAVREVFLFVDGQCELSVEPIAAGAGAHDADDRLGQILLARGDVSSETLRDALSDQKRIGELLVSRGDVREGTARAAIVEQQHLRRARRDAAVTEEAATLRVPARKLDSLVDLVGELVIAQARLSQLAQGRDDAELLNVAEVVERLASNLRDNTLNIRMVPIGTTFGRFRRLVRDVAAELGKDIELVTDGAETELDKTVIDRLGDPLVHVIRNACDHGIERPQERTSRHKPARGVVRLSAYQSGPSVVIEVRDDGNGLDAEAIRAKAVQRGLITADAPISERDLFNLVFLPGFSTAKEVSNLSGRGVGMDVVKRSIEELRGSVELSSEPGAGTTLKLKLPLTLAIIDGLLVAVGEARYVLPTSLVTECVELTRDDVARSNGNQCASVRGELVPYVRLRDWFDAGGDRPDIEQIAIAATDGMRFGFVVDQVIGQHQTVIKTLGRRLRGVAGLSGATILGNGTVALIVDLPSIAHAASRSAAVTH